ncbi:prolipoprotein diacylglyceryl transferase [bacterium]|nr:prolipoprotein diacylglyceryl transferase [bacterium]
MLPHYRFLGSTLHSWGYILAIIAVFLFSVWYGRKLKMEAEKAIFFAVLIVPLITGGMPLLGFIDGGGGFNWVRIAVFAPFVVYAACLALDMPFGKTFDFIAPGAAIQHGVAHIFCIFAGCCNGYPSAFGIWNAKKHDYLFPIQLVEAVSSLLVCFYIVWYAKKRNYEVRGISYGQYLFLFGLTRTIWEFFRDNTEFRWQISTFQYYSFAAYLLGAIWINIIFYLREHPEFVKKHELLFREDVGELTRIKMFLRRKNLSGK